MIETPIIICLPPIAAQSWPNTYGNNRTVAYIQNPSNAQKPINRKYIGPRYSGLPKRRENGVKTASSSAFLPCQRGSSVPASFLRFHALASKNELHLEKPAARSLLCPAKAKTAGPPLLIPLQHSRPLSRLGSPVSVKRRDYSRTRLGGRLLTVYQKR